MKKASIDLGTNTALFLVADVVDGEVRSVVHDQSTMVRLGQGVDLSKRLHPDAAARTLACLRGYAARATSFGVKPSDVVCVATATARDAENGAEFFAQVTRETGLRFRTISGDEEARSMFLGGLLPGMSAENSAVVDIGGGSTEFRSQQGGLSLQMGSVRFTERFLKSDPVTDVEFWAAQSAIDFVLEGALRWRDSMPGKTELVAVAGTAVTLAQIQLGLPHYDAAQIDGTELTRGDIHRLVEELKWRTVGERKTLPGMEPGRADVLLAGALILWRVLENI
jgi:exopolyphosphatase/guanosine-5'-triphosphate,3'-diphosphate pyrophosphatase